MERRIMKDSQEIFREAEASHVEHLEAVNAKLLAALEFWERWSRYHPHKESHSEDCDFCEGNRMTRAAIEAAKGDA
jgi:hypothetical protein